MIVEQLSWEPENTERVGSCKAISAVAQSCSIRAILFVNIDLKESPPNTYENELMAVELKFCLLETSILEWERMNGLPLWTLFMGFTASAKGPSNLWFLASPYKRHRHLALGIGCR